MSLSVRKKILAPTNKEVTKIMKKLLEKGKKEFETERAEDKEELLNQKLIQLQQFEDDENLRTY